MMNVDVIRKRGEDGGKRSAVVCSLQEDADYRRGAIHRFVNQMQFHVEPAAINAMLAGGMEVELVELILHVTKRQPIRAGLVDLDLDGVAVVEDGAGRPRIVVNP
jgi:hypothetical protein